jgi:CelD/BcsL family acetyltransferase involved in cellulose biosynthesis
LIETHDDFEPLLVKEWEELADRAAVVPFLHPGWFMAWWQAFGRGRLEILAVRRDGRLRAVAPMRRRLGRLASASNFHTPMFGLLADDQGAAGELAHALMRRAGHSMTLTFVDDQVMPTHQALIKAAALWASHRELERSPYIDIQSSWETYEEGLGTKRRRELRRRRRRLEELGRLTFEVRQDGQDLERLLDEGFSVEGSGWKDARGTAIRAKQETRLFYREVARWSAQRGWLLLGFLRLDGQPLAFDYCLEYTGVHYLLKTGYDPAFRQLAPGTLLRYEMIRRAHRTGLARYDFLGGDYPWKLEWTDRSRPRWELRGFPRSPLGSVGLLSYAVAYGGIRPVVIGVRRTAARAGWR